MDKGGARFGTMQKLSAIDPLELEDGQSRFMVIDILQVRNSFATINCEWTVSFEIVSTFEWRFNIFVACCLQHLQSA